MQLTIKATGGNVKVISHLLSKNPGNLYERSQKDHFVRMFFSKFRETEVEATIFVSPDPLSLVNHKAQGYDITHYINDREFAVSSIFTSLIRSALGTALNGKPEEEYNEWVDHAFNFRFSFGPVATDLDEDTIKGLFEPLGYSVDFEYGEIDYTFRIKERSSAMMISISGMVTLQKGLQQLFVLIPVLDNYKHYYIDEKEIDKIERYGEGWLIDHPVRDFILRRSLRFKELYSQAGTAESTAPTKRVSLNELRYEAIAEKVGDLPKRKSVVDFGSGEGKLSAKLAFIEGVEEILAVEPSETETVKAMKRFEKLREKDNFTEPKQLWGSLFYFDERLMGKDVMILCEVIEHIDADRLPKAMELIVNHYQPITLIVTTPNREYNEVYEMEEARRHTDHRFEWTRKEFTEWCNRMNKSGLYELSFEGIGDVHEKFGAPTQMCTFSRKEERP